MKSLVEFINESKYWRGKLPLSKILLTTINAVYNKKDKSVTEDELYGLAQDEIFTMRPDEYKEDDDLSNFLYKQCQEDPEVDTLKYTEAIDDEIEYNYEFTLDDEEYKIQFYLPRGKRVLDF